PGAIRRHGGGDARRGGAARRQPRDQLHRVPRVRLGAAPGDALPGAERNRLCGPRRAPRPAGLRSHCVARRRGSRRPAGRRTACLLPRRPDGPARRGQRVGHRVRPGVRCGAAGRHGPRPRFERGCRHRADRYVRAVRRRAAGIDPLPARIPARCAGGTVEQRRRALLGFVFSRLNPETMFGESMAAAASRSLAMAIYDSTTSADAMLVSSGEPPATRRSTAGVLIAGREWLVVASAREARSAVLPPEARRILAAGGLLSLLLFALMRAQVGAWHTAEMHAAELHATDRAKDEFLAVLSHELRTPLNAMLGWLQMLRNGSVREDRRTYALDIIERNARSQAQLIDDLLEMSRIMMGKMRLEKRPLSVVAATTAVVDSLRPDADAKGVTLHGVEAGKGEDPMIVADPGRFAQIITNLVSNGVKFTPAGGAVWVNIEADPQNVRIFVHATCVGISPEFLPYVFDRFRQADSSTTRSHSGLGMGLAIVRDLVRLHRGHIEAYSNGPKQGSLFVVTLPRMVAEGDDSDGPELVASHA